MTALGLQHVLVMYAGAIAVPLIVGRALKLAPEQVALLISADLFARGIVTLIQSLGMTKWFGSKLLRFFPPVVTGTIIGIIGISLMRVGVGWAMGGPPNLAQNVDVPKLVAMVDGAKAAAAQAAEAAASGAAGGGVAGPSVAAPVLMLSGPVPMVAPRWTQQMAHGLHPLLESGILLTAIAALVLNIFFNGAKGDGSEAIEAAKAADAH